MWLVKKLTGVTDTGVTDTGVTDTGVNDTGVNDTSVTDAEDTDQNNEEIDTETPPQGPYHGGALFGCGTTRSTSYTLNSIWLLFIAMILRRRTRQAKSILKK